MLRRSALAVALTCVPLVSLLMAQGCGPGEGPCADVTCDYGVCAPESGECVNPDTCENPNIDRAPVDAGGDATGGDAAVAAATPVSPEQRRGNCLRGYSCVAGICQANQPCGDDNPCDRGTCLKGACVNKSECESDSDCARGYGCDTENNQCVVDFCDGKSCDRGVCDPETGSCVDAETCPFPDKQRPACREGHRCLEEAGECFGEEAFCEELDCQRGVCDFRAGECVNAETCEGDGDCAEGYYCTEEGTCEPNRCDTENVICDRGVCDAAEAKCVNPDSCQISTDCLPMHVCVENTCRPEDEKCGEEGCPGNQRCVYDAESLSTRCEESDSGCLDAVDCKDNRVCVQGTCATPSECENDDLEPNDTAESASSYFDVIDQGQVSGSICQEDTDVFLFDTERDDNFRGRFIVSLTFERIDVGVGDVVVEVLDDDGEQFAKATSDEQGRVRIDEFLGAGDGGVFEIHVRDKGNVGIGGVDYTLLADILGRTVQRACDEATELTDGTAEGNSLSGSSFSMTASCVLDSDEIGEDVFTFELEETRYVKLDVTPASDEVDVAVSLRRQCGIASTEVACRNLQRTAESESLRQALRPGRYYVIVQGADTNSGGSFTVNFATDPATCTPADNQCISETAARVCSANGTELVRDDCAQGCNEELGVCEREPGDVCREVVDATDGVENRNVRWDQLTNTFNPGTDSCLSASEPASGGPDAVHRVDLEHGEGLLAELEMAAFTDGSLYLFERCNPNGSFCKVGQDTDDSTEVLGYRNESGSAETVYVVADAEEGATGTAELDIQVDEIVCQPGITSCRNDGAAVCNPAGIGFDSRQNCSFGCTDGECVADTCEVAREVTGSHSETVDSGKFEPDYDLGSFNDCVGTETPGSDLLYSVTVPPEGWVTASVTDETGKGTNPAIYLVENCQSAATHESTCLEASNADKNGTETISRQNRTESDQTYYVVVDETKSDPRSGRWKIDIEVSPKVCEPGTTSCLDDAPETLQYCGARGLEQKEYTCQGDTTDCVSADGRAACPEPQGDLCVDAVPVTDGETKTGTFSDQEATDDLNLRKGYHGSCQIESTASGPDHVYRVDLAEKDLLTANLETEKRDARLYVLGSCYKEETCRAYREGSGEVYHYAEEAQSILVAVDSESADAGKEFTVDFEVASDRECAPGGTRCSKSDTVGYCNDTGTGYEFEYGCVSSGCSDGSCEFDQTAANTCSEAPSIANGSVIVSNFDDYNDSISLSDNSCAGTSTDGPDAFYSVDVPAGEFLAASIDARGDADPALYLFEDCSNPESTCLKGASDASRGGSTQIFERFSQNRTLLLGVDSDGASSGEFELRVRTQPPECQTDDRVCGRSVDSLQFCSYPGEWKDYTCNEGCTDGHCGEPTYNTCADPGVVEGGSGSFTKDMELTTNDFQLPFNSCVGDGTPGNDMVFQVEAEEEQIINVKAKPFDEDGNPTIALTKECSRMAFEGNSACVKGIDGEGDGDEEEFNYQVPDGSGGTYYVIVDADHSDNEGTFDVDINVTDP